MFKLFGNMVDEDKKCKPGTKILIIVLTVILIIGIICLGLKITSDKSHGRK